jgi:RNA polymerase sigma-32 factor
VDDYKPPNEPIIPYASQEGEGDLQAYYRQIRQFPLLEPDEEYELAKKWFEKQDLNAAKKLITSHLRLVAKIANGYRGYGLPMADLISEGNVGILQALKKFDPEKGFRFSTYAVWWIKASIQEYVLKSWSLVKVGTTASQKKLFFNLRRLKQKLQSAQGENFLSDESVGKMAEELEVTEKEVREMEERMSFTDSSLNATVSGEEGTGEWQDWLENPAPNQEEEAISKDEHKKRTELLRRGFQYLTPRERMILEARQMSDPSQTLDQVSKTLNISKERVRQIELLAFKKLRDSIRREISKHQ